MNKHKNVKEMVTDLSPSEFAKEVCENIDSKNIVKQLIVLRTKGNLSQEQLATLLKWSTERIIKIEEGMDKDLTLSDIVDYYWTCVYQK